MAAHEAPGEDRETPDVCPETRRIADNAGVEGSVTVAAGGPGLRCGASLFMRVRKGRGGSRVVDWASQELQDPTMRTLICLVSALLGSTAAAQDHRLTAARLDGDVLHLQTAGGLQNVRHFELPDPPRVVLDLFGIRSSFAEMPAPAAGSAAIEVRTGEHPDFLRVVVDLTRALSSYQVRRSEGLIEVGLGPAALPSSSAGVLIASSPVPTAPSRPPRNTAPANTTQGKATAPVSAAPKTAPVVAVGVEASPAADPSPTAEAAPTAQAATQVVAAPVVAGDRANAEDPSTDELPALDDLSALIEAELKAAGLDQEQSAEELIEQVEAELEANRLRSIRESDANSPSTREEPGAAERRRRRTLRQVRTPPPADGEERLPFRYVDEEPAKDPPPG